MADETQAQERLSAWEEAEAEGMDMSLIECNLQRSILERMIVHDRALTLALELRAAMRRRERNASA
jgi:hypothetical protein